MGSRKIILFLINFEAQYNLLGKYFFYFFYYNYDRISMYLNAKMETISIYTEILNSYLTMF